MVLAHSNVRHHVFPNGLVLIAETMDYVRTAAFNFLIPAGYAYDPATLAGTSNLLSGMITRGAGPFDNQALMLEMDALGLDREESVGMLHTRIWGATIARNLLPSLELYSHVVLRPHLPDAELPPIQALALQDIEALEDDPKGKTMLELRRRHLPAPLGNDRRGTPESIEANTVANLKAFHRRHFRPNATILSVAGNIDWQALVDKVGLLFGDWSPQPEVTLSHSAAELGKSHLQKDTQQTQIGLAYDSIPVTDKDYFNAMGAVQVLSGGMSSRLFTEVREKKGLCYSVWASYQGMKDRGVVLCYAGTTNERAQDTLDSMLLELKRIEDGIEPDEVQRIQAGIKSSLIMQEESTSARAGAIASDWYYYGRVRPFEEIQAEVNALTAEKIVDYCRRKPLVKGTLVTMGPRELNYLSSSVS
ncbi:MAG: insulinase family protein [Planctomycetia bacterium]|nr:insulinase family protein [Planctomycetia bacterium]